MVTVCCFQVTWSAQAKDIVKEAKSHKGSVKWSYASSYGTGKNTYKCNLFVHDVLKNVGANPPTRWSLSEFRWAQIGAAEWGNPNSSYLNKSKFWIKCKMPRQPGDVISDGKHVGIITGKKLTTSATKDKVVENDWGFRQNGAGAFKSITACWRHCN